MVARRFRLAAALSLASLATAGCKRGAGPASGPEVAAAGGARGGAVTTAPPPPTPAGMKAPFERRTPPAAKSFSAGVKAYRAGKHGEAAQLFHEVVAALPDDTAARYQELRSAVRADPNADLREPVRALLWRDFVGYDRRLRTGKDFAPLWTSPYATELEAIRAAARTAYTDGLASGVFFVGRNRPGQPVLYDEHAKSVLDLALEAYWFDPARGLVRRLTETAGRVAGMRVDRANKRVALLLVNDLVSSEVETGTAFAAVAAATLSLDTLEMVGPIALPLRANMKNVVLCTTAKGEARWILGDARYAIDAAKRRVVAVKKDDCTPGTTTVTPERAWLQRPVETSADGGVINLAVDGGSQPIKIADLARSGASFDWSPGRSRAAITRLMDPCELAPSGWLPERMNTLNVWDAAAGKTSRLATAFSFFEYEWLDDDHLVYEGSTPKGGKIVVHDFRTQTDTALDVPAGAGLSAVPSYECIMPTVETGEDPEGE
ncbi:MAG TPA: hypothetical protein VGP64_05240 [Polyangia bacterium]|jgi:hypothetical protein